MSIACRFLVVIGATFCVTAHAERDLSVGISAYGQTVSGATVEPSSFVIAADTTAPNEFERISAATGESLGTTRFFNPNWRAVATTIVVDQGSRLPNTVENPTVAVLATSIVTGQHKVQRRGLSSGELEGSNITFFSSAWETIDISPLFSSDASGVSSLAVLARNRDNGRVVVELRSKQDGAFEGRWKFFTPEWRPVAVVAMSDNLSDSVSESIAVLATHEVSGISKIQRIELASGAKTGLFVSGPDIVTSDLLLLADGDGNGPGEDPAFISVGKKIDGNIIARRNDLLTGARLGDIRVVNASWEPKGAALFWNIDADGFPELGVLAEQNTTGSVIVQVRDPSGGERVATYTVFEPPTQRSLDIGTGNTVIELSSTLYAREYSVIVTDQLGRPVSGEFVDVSTEAVSYRKGFWFVNAAAEWQQRIEAQCIAEDANRNGLLDAGEDTNSNGLLDPGNLVSIAPIDPSQPLNAGCTSVTSANAAAIVEANSLGIARFCVIYNQDNAFWGEVEISAEIASGNDLVRAFESSFLTGIESDYDDEDVFPPGQISPYGQSSVCTDPN